MVLVRRMKMAMVRNKVHHHGINNLIKKTIVEVHIVTMVLLVVLLRRRVVKKVAPHQ